MSSNFNKCSVWSALWIATLWGGLTLSVPAAEVFQSSHVERIWDAAPHSAFTDLIRVGGRFYCTFREGTGHVPGADGGDGIVRVIVSDDGSRWATAVSFEVETIDLRDPKLSLTPDDRLMCLMGGSYYRGGQLERQLPRVAFSNEARTSWHSTQPIDLDEAIATSRDWLWRVTWHEGTAYGVVYQSGGDGSRVQLVKSSDGIHYDSVKDLALVGSPNEATIRFRDNGEMRMVVRREGANQRGMLGHSHPPYTDWTWHEISQRLGGPNFLILPDGHLILGTRKHGSEGARTMIGALAEDGEVTELVELPSGGDTSYPGMLVHDEQLYVSYYSSHEEKTAIYLARIPLARLSVAE